MQSTAVNLEFKLKVIFKLLSCNRSLKLEVRHKNSHGCTHTKRTDTRTQARTYMYARMYSHTDTHLYLFMRLYTYSARADPDQTPYIVASDQGLYCLLLQ